MASVYVPEPIGFSLAVFRSDFSVQAEPFHCSTKPLTVELELPPATRAAAEVPMFQY